MQVCAKEHRLDIEDPAAFSLASWSSLHNCVDQTEEQLAAMSASDQPSFLQRPRVYSMAWIVLQSAVPMRWWQAEEPLVYAL